MKLSFQLYIKVLITCILFFTMKHEITAQNYSKQIEEIKASVIEFSRCNDYTDTDAFEKCFAEDSRMFAPFTANRFEGIKEIMNVVAPVHKRIRELGGNPPYFNLVPLDLDIQMLSENIGVATWQFDLGNRIGRRTLVYVKKNGKWLIKNFHSSNFPKNN